MLPHDLDVALKYLSDGELSALSRAVTAELDRRNSLMAKPLMEPAQPKRKPAQKVEGLTQSQINLIQASVKAGVKPAVLSRQFGLSQAQIRAALKAGG
ncbi:hypothetical protein [Thalassovita autumnalis]|jgi:hypothetical protein|uniref:hypothetical protein n=1 Tax=Rhodobacterales TaxID=204455 RepID=UPI00071D5724|nr:hypothetical protein [Thalassovita autumnalis]